MGDPVALLSCPFDRLGLSDGTFERSPGTMLLLVERGVGGGFIGCMISDGTVLARRLGRSFFGGEAA